MRGGPEPAVSLDIAPRRESMRARVLSLCSLALATAALLSPACQDKEGSLGSGASGSSSSGAGAGTGTGGGGGSEPLLGQDCSVYCQSMQAACVEDNAIYADEGQCVDVCENFPRGEPTDTSGNTLGCRLYYVRFADDSPEDAALNCRY